ncbi:helix-turn-helix domain-containing protein [Diaphorobacter nitroreducens]|uniref:helix-turn-helix domain-containing protein n=1 Tax=Diaphorobacter nitroreducens TaxID=164759 RepID=UPI00289E3671|nr:helix-turn-helix transcriptional regulator [Diaphorobacter nitroreducens]
MADAVEVGSTNVYADLGYPDAEALQRKASLASHIAWTIKARHLTHEAAAELLGIDQADIVKIVRGQFRSTSEAMMLEWIAMLGHDVTILVTKTARQRRGRLGWSSTAHPEHQAHQNVVLDRSRDHQGRISSASSLW